MKTIIKLSILEFIGGLFGWVWIIASLAAVYFFVMAVFFDGGWSNFMFAFAVGLAGRELLKGFQEAKNDVPSEKISGSDEIISNFDEVEQIIQKYSLILQESAPAAGCVADESKLPYSKDVIKKAIVIALQNTESGEMAESLKVSYLMLANWQIGVGSSDHGIDFSKVTLDKTTFEIAQELTKSAQAIDAWSDVVNKEHEELKKELESLNSKAN